MKKLHLTVSLVMLLVSAVFAVYLLFNFSYIPFIQFYVLGGFGATYIIWSIFHHKLDKSLTLVVFLEYLLTALLVLVLLLGIFVYR